MSVFKSFSTSILYYFIFNSISFQRKKKVFFTQFESYNYSDFTNKTNDRLNTVYTTTQQCMKYLLSYLYFDQLQHENAVYT